MLWLTVIGALIPRAGLRSSTDHKSGDQRTVSVIRVPTDSPPEVAWTITL